MGTLFLVATPIGNLEDMSPRAVRILREARLIAAEDTRHTRQLLTHFDIHTALTSYYEHNKLSKMDAILAALSLGDVALVSDAGTPAINDPGYELVKAALNANHIVSPIPGPSAPVAALAISGLPTDSFLYLGYLPRKTSERKALFAGIESLPYTLLFLESPHRVLESLADMQTSLGDREIAAARELTKIYEQVVRGCISQVIAHFTQHEPRGEFVLVVSGRPADLDNAQWSEEQVNAAIQDALQTDRPAKEIAAELGRKSGWARREIYKMLLEKKE
ncbi:MAG: 16S rRNA (cytidine(1402)-2'-O)-methyltransferase [Chloroflexi bacterium]|nr:16S rRNA (cytidine(1402)-2'-O)-methyltransferase [Chloroflexota bacterium]